jgi:hypothetical protein
MMSGLEGATATAPIEPVGWSSKIGVQVRPESVVFQTPPLQTPMKSTFGCEAIPATAFVRPPLKGPMLRQRISPNDRVVSR